MHACELRRPPAPAARRGRSTVIITIPQGVNPAMSAAKFAFARQRVSAADLATIAASSVQCSIDTAVADKLAAAWTDAETKEARNAKPAPAAAAGDATTSASAPASALPRAYGDGDACAHLSHDETRALMVARLVSLLHGRALVRPAALHLLVGASLLCLS